ncbi:MAG TPA: glutathionylspermidine synthase family protein, partial [Saprospiraceae bacterium]|nr:glutathionylspermidine synthase family protein [Saprospiraceae bacterium]
LNNLNNHHSMIQKQAITQLPNQVFNELGWDYFISEEATDYLTTEMVVVQEKERDVYYETGNRLYDLFVQAGTYVVQHNLLDTLGIPRNLQELVRISWEDDRHLHLFGRFDFAGGIDGLPVKLLEFNADTPTSLPETAIIQWAQLKANGLPEEAQFNHVYDALIDNFKRLKTLNPDREPAILFSTLRGAKEDDDNVSLLVTAAGEAGFETRFCYVDEVNFSDTEGIFAPDGSGSFTRFDFWFKLVPWEYIAQDEPELCGILTQIVRRDLAVILNPAYTMLFQSKAMLKYLWDLFPEDPALLEASLVEPVGKSNFAFVQKVFFGREGANVSIHDEIGLPVEVRGGDYEKQSSVYQALAQLARDESEQYYQAGVFFAYESCGLGFRRSRQRIIDNGAQFVGHVIR